MRKGSSRNTTRIDYKIYYRTGKKVLKESAKLEELANKLEKDLVMVENRLIDDEKKIGLKIVGFWDEYELDDLYGVDDINDSITELKNLKSGFENIHVDLKRELGEGWSPTYPKYDDDVRRMTNWIKNDRKEIAKRKREEEDLIKAERKRAENLVGENNVNMASEQALLKTDEKYLVIRIDQQLTKIDFENADEVYEIERDLLPLGGLLKKYLAMHHKLEISFGNEYVAEFDSEINKRVDHINEVIIMGQEKIKSIKQEAKYYLEKREAASAQAEYDSKVTLSQFIQEEVNTRVASFEKTYDVEKLKGFDDEQILEKKKGAEKLDGELNEIMGRITYLVKETLKYYIDDGKIVTKASKTICTLYDTKKNFFKGIREANL